MMADSGLDIHTSAYKETFSYALDNDLILNWYPQRILKLAKGNSLLELGLGHGYSALILSKHFSRYLVIEGSGEVIQLFKANHSSETGIEITRAFFEDFITTEKYDNIVMGFIMEHVEDPGLILDKYKKLLAPGGSVYITVPNAEALNKRLGYEAGLIDDLMKLGPGDLELGHRRLFTVPGLKELVSKHGYRIKTIEGLLLKPITTAQIITLGLPRNILEAMLKVGVNYPELCVGILMEVGVEE